MKSTQSLSLVRLRIVALSLAITGAHAQTQTAPASTTAPAPTAVVAPTPTPAPKPTAVPVDPTVAAPKKDSGAFLEKHQSFLKRGKEGPIGVLFLGDSITAGWSTAPQVWQSFYGDFKPANFGISGDQTQHVLWRIQNGELDGIKPRLVVLMIGTNNTGANTAVQIAAADKKIVQQIRAKIPAAKVLVLAIFPRGPRKGSDGTMDDGVKRMEIITEVNKELAKLDDGKMVRFLDINKKFLNPQGKIPNDVMPDQLHPNIKGYEIWAKAMHPTFLEMLGEKPSPKPSPRSDY